MTFAGHGTWLLGAPGVVGRELPAGLAAMAADTRPLAVGC